MARRIILTPAAKADVRDAFGEYEGYSPSLGEKFMDELGSVLGLIALNPRLFPRRFDSYHRALTRRFPYAVYYDFDEETVTIYYVFHCAQNPERVRERLRPTGEA